MNDQSNIVSQGLGSTGATPSAAELGDLARRALEGDNEAAQALNSFPKDAATQAAITAAYEDAKQDAKQDELFGNVLAAEEQKAVADQSVQDALDKLAGCSTSECLKNGEQEYLKAAAEAKTADEELEKANRAFDSFSGTGVDSSGKPCVVGSSADCKAPSGPGTTPKPDPTKTPPGGQTPPGAQTPGGQQRPPSSTGFGGSPSGGSPQQQQQQRPSTPTQQTQQQCQPQYQCTTNGSISTATGAMPVSVVMYNQCPQQGAQWQQYQQCPQGYSCQNNGCVAVAPYGYCSDGRTPRTGPAQQQPPASSCTVGTWTDASNGCQTNWQCTNGSGSNGTLTAQLSCQPLVAASGTTITFSYACAGGATTASSTGFTLSSATTLSGTASTVLQKPASGSTVTYALTCTNASVTPNTTAGAQCTVQVGKSSIVLVATPEKISKAETDDAKKKSTIGWVTSGMQSCLISNPDFPEWTTQQASNTSVGGAVVSPAITADTTFKLTCQTLGGTEASSTVKVLSI